MSQALSQAVSCADCEACCCRLEVMLIGDDVPARYTEANPWGGEVMRRLDDGWCAALDRNSMRCTIYGRRPDICRDFEMGASDCVAERTLFYSRPA